MHEHLESTSDKIRILAEWIKESKRIVFFGGAGTSAESGIKPFRGPDGLFSEKWWSNSPISTESVALSTIFVY